MTPARFTLPNLLSLSRLAMVPVLIHLTVTERPAPFLAVLAACLVSDALDGWLARRLGQVSALGAALDTWGDFAVYVTVPVCGWWLWPEQVRPEAPFLLVLAVSYLSPIAVGWARHGRLTNHHTLSGKVSTILLAAASVALIAGGPPWPFRLATLIVVLADLEEIVLVMRPRSEPGA
jgi:CDP-diacylglycerol--glycerol-3-phosphate 3-phosphatidyltransferase